MQIPKRYLETFYQTLKGTEGVLGLADSRVRDAFMKPLTEATQTFEAERKAIYERFCTKNEDGTPDTQDGNYHFEPTDLADVNAELQTLLGEEVELTPPTKLKELLEQSTYKPKVGEAEQIDAITALI